jgi:riboflavin kinase/FMN adenylyltransferase
VYAGMMSIGTNPTVSIDPFLRTIEVHILNYTNDIYGKKLTMVFRKRLRDEIKFDSREQLASQMELDKKQVLQLLG